MLDRRLPLLVTLYTPGVYRVTPPKNTVLERVKILAALHILETRV
jgi:hypothetical protein